MELSTKCQNLRVIEHPLIIQDRITELKHPTNRIKQTKVDKNNLANNHKPWTLP